mmetsp:Transcript_14360/g.21495  ORF Transcript_14360/g.21495 Transcript_14360/m.21495 type:complete len:411 (-) Transcript_14360:274-1506(-)
MSSSSSQSIFFILLLQLLLVVSTTSFVLTDNSNLPCRRNIATLTATAPTVTSLALASSDSDNVKNNADHNARSKVTPPLFQKNIISDRHNTSRRSALFRTITTTAGAAVSASNLLLWRPSPSVAAGPPTPPPMVLPKNAMYDSAYDMNSNGLLESRVTENVLSPPPYGMEGNDIFYPSYFQGVWSVNSVTTAIKAPCGVQLFGGNYTYNSALQTIGPDYALNYKCRFIPSSAGGKIIADREYNIREIAKAAMGSNSVVDIPLATPNKLSCLLSPMGASSMMVAEILTLARRQENFPDDEKANTKIFHCAEVVRQIVSPVDSYKATSSGSLNSPPPSSGGRTTLLKEIETASLYEATPTKSGDVTEIRCRQRTATFLLPSQTDPLAYQLWQMSRGRPIDVRFFDVVYTKQV